MGLPREEARNRGEDQQEQRGGRWKGAQGHVQSWGQKGGSYLPPLEASSDAAGVSQGCSCTKLLISSVKPVGCRTPSHMGFICPGCSNSS